MIPTDNFENFKEGLKNKKITQPSSFEKVVKSTTSIVRMEMIQLGLNPFNPEDIAHYYKLQAEGGELGFFKRLKAAASLLFKAKVNEDLETFVLKGLNKKIKTTDLPEDSLVGDYKPFSSSFIEKISKSSPSGFPRDSEEYKKDLIDSLKMRVETPISPLEHIVPIEPQETIPVITETDEEAVKRITKPPTKRVHFKTAQTVEGTKLPVSRGSKKRITPKKDTDNNTPSRPKRKR